MMDENPNWRAVPAVTAPGLQVLLTAWSGWRAEGRLPLRAQFDPMAFREQLPWIMLGEILDHPNPSRPYDMMLRSIGTELELYFAANAMSRTHLSEVDAAFTERWFRVLDDARATRTPHVYHGAPYRTGYDYITMELLSLPLSRDGAEVDFVLFALARLQPPISG